jgi:hypothetical protein
MKQQPGLQTDERSVSIFRRVCAQMYLATIAALWLDVLYRQLWRHQPVTEFMDLALVLIANVVIAIAAILYNGGIVIPRLRASIVAVFYAVCVIAGTAFWMLKDPESSAGAIVGRFLIVASASAIFILLYLLAVYLGARKLERRLSG